MDPQTRLLADGEPFDCIYLATRGDAGQEQVQLYLKEPEEPDRASAGAQSWLNLFQSVSTATQPAPDELAAAAAAAAAAGWSRFDETELNFLTALYSLTAFASFALNVLAVIVLARGRRNGIKKFLINLSMSDLLMSLLSIPFTYKEIVLERWVFPHFLCPLVHSVVILGVFVSAATMTLIGLNRYSAIAHPLKPRRTAGIRHPSKGSMIAATWLLGLLVSFPEYLMTKPKAHCDQQHQIYWVCQVYWPDSTSAHLYTIFLYLCTFVAPLCLSMYLYAAISLRLLRRQVPGNVDATRDMILHSMRVKVIKMLFVVVLVYAVSWLPMQTYSMLLFLFPSLAKLYTSGKHNLMIVTYFAFHWLSMAHSCLNPLIYCFMNDEFRAELQALLSRPAAAAAAATAAAGRPPLLAPASERRPQVRAVFGPRPARPGGATRAGPAGCVCAAGPRLGAGPDEPA